MTFVRRVGIGQGGLFRTVEEARLRWPKPDRFKGKDIISSVDKFRNHGWDEVGVTKLRLELGYIFIVSFYGGRIDATIRD